MAQRWPQTGFAYDIEDDPVMQLNPKTLNALRAHPEDEDFFAQNPISYVKLALPRLRARAEELVTLMCRFNEDQMDMLLTPQIEVFQLYKPHEYRQIIQDQSRAFGSLYLGFYAFCYYRQITRPVILQHLDREFGRVLAIWLQVAAYMDDPRHAIFRNKNFWNIEFQPLFVGTLGFLKDRWRWMRKSLLGIIGDLDAQQHRSIAGSLWAFLVTGTLDRTYASCKEFKKNFPELWNSSDLVIENGWRFGPVEAPLPLAFNLSLAGYGDISSMVDPIPFKQDKGTIDALSLNPPVPFKWERMSDEDFEEAAKITPEVYKGARSIAQRELDYLNRARFPDPQWNTRRAFYENQLTLQEPEVTGAQLKEAQEQHKVEICEALTRDNFPTGLSKYRRLLRTDDLPKALRISWGFTTEACNHFNFAKPVTVFTSIYRGEKRPKLTINAPTDSLDWSEPEDEGVPEYSGKLPAEEKYEQMPERH